MYSLGTQGRHIDPGADETGACGALMDNLIAGIPAVEPARGALLALLQMGPSERTQRWLLKQFDHVMCLLGERIKKFVPSKHTSPGSPWKLTCGQPAAG